MQKNEFETILTELDFNKDSGISSASLDDENEYASYEGWHRPQADPGSVIDVNVTPSGDSPWHKHRVETVILSVEARTRALVVHFSSDRNSWSQYLATIKTDTELRNELAWTVQE